MRYGQLHEMQETPEQYRIQVFMWGMDRIDFGNCGVPTAIQEYFRDKKENIQDVFIGEDSMYILPATEEVAEELYDLIVPTEAEDGEATALADEVSWLKLEDRYWLHLWWD